MEHIGKRVVLAVAQQPFEVTSGTTTNTFATLVPLMGMDGAILDRADFRRHGLVFWMVWKHALRFADPGRLIAGRLEEAVNPERSEYQLAPDSAEIAQPTDVIEILSVDNPVVRDVRDLVNTDPALLLDHAPTPLVLVRWGDDVWGPFRTECVAPDQGHGSWRVNLRTNRADQAVFRIPAGDLAAAGRFGPHYYSNLQAGVSLDDRDPTRNSAIHTCHYSILLGAGFKRLPSMGYPLVNVETDKELLLRYARRFLTRKDLQRLREILQTVEASLDPRAESAPEAERLVFEAIKHRAGLIDEELAMVARSIVGSGLIENQITAAVSEKAQEYILQQAATLSSEIATRVADLSKELEDLEHQRNTINDELESKRRQTEREIEKSRDEFEQYRLGEESRITTARLDLGQQRDQLSRHLESAIQRYRDSREAVLNEFITLAPLFERAGFRTSSPAPSSPASLDGGRNPGETLQLPAFVLASEDESAAPLTELQFFERFERHVKDAGYNYRRLDLISFHVSVKCCDITILGGLSGTGKSTLPALYAEALAGGAAIFPPERYLHVGVSPAWLDMRDLIGHVNSLDRRFEPSESGLFRQLINAHHEYIRKQQQSGIYLVTLDEMNLAHVEYYFSGFLQALEHSREIRSFDASSVEPSIAFAPYARLTIPRSVRFVGTVNFDETTKQLSLRLLDRANLIQLRPVEQTSFFSAGTEQRPRVDGPPVRMQHFREWRRTLPLERDLATLWDRLQQSLTRLGTPITPRRRQAILEFVASVPPELATPLQALDLQIAQRLVPHIRGLYRPGAQEALEELEHGLTQHAYGFAEAVAAIIDLRRNEQVGLPLTETFPI
jgi:hypothetical protein